MEIVFILFFIGALFYGGLWKIVLPVFAIWVMLFLISEYRHHKTWHAEKPA